MQELLDQGISSRRGVMAIHRERSYRDEKSEARLPETNLVADTAIILPLFYEMSEEEQDYVINSLKEVEAMARR
jgi:dTDP-4-amino-4,6-dideoxygalactose transaminase